MVSRGFPWPGLVLCALKVIPRGFPLFPVNWAGVVRRHLRGLPWFPVGWACAVRLKIISRGFQCFPVGGAGAVRSRICLS